MDNLLLQTNKNTKNENEEYPKINIKKKLTIQSNDYSTKKFGSVIQRNKNIFLDINKLFSKNQNRVLNPSILSKKGSSMNKKSNNINSLSNSNILLKTTEENLLQNINNNNDIFPKKSLKNIKKLLPKKDSKKNLDKLENKILKNVIKFYRKFFSSENEILENSQEKKQKNKSSTKILNIKIIKEIEKEKEKIISEKKRNSVMKCSSSSNIHNLENFTKNKTFFQLNTKTKKKSKNFERNLSQLSNIEAYKRKKIGNISKSDYLTIKTLKKVNSDISKQIRKSSISDIKKEIKELEKLDITDLIQKSKKKNNIKNKRRKSLIESTIIFDKSKIKENIKKEDYQNRFRNLFFCNNLFDSLDDDENEDLEKMPKFFIGPNEPLCYIIDSITLIISLMYLAYIPYFLVSN